MEEWKNTVVNLSQLINSCHSTKLLIKKKDDIFQTLGVSWGKGEKVGEKAKIWLVVPCSFQVVSEKKPLASMFPCSSVEQTEWHPPAQVW